MRTHLCGKLRFSVILALVIVLTSSAMASVLHVSPVGSDATGSGTIISPFGTIQHGIDQATDGDTILVADGTYHERVSFKSKNIVVSSWILTEADSAHISSTIIDGDSSGLPSSDSLSVVRIVNVVGTPALAGFTIVNGPTEGILCAGAGAEVRNCILVNNGYRKTYGSITPSTNPSLQKCHLVSCGVKTGNGPLVLSKCDIDGLIERVGIDVMVEADSSIIGGVNFDGSGYFHARSCLIEGDILGLVAGRYLIDCTVNGTINTHDATLTADSCVIGNIRCGNESVGNVRRSVIKGSIGFSGIDLTPTLTLSHCTVLDSIYRTSNKVGLTLDSCNLSLSTPLHFDQYWRWIRIHCSNIYANGSAWFDGTPDTTISSIFDTSGVFSLPPQFCNAGLGDYTLFDTSPCAPANNACGVVIGARDVGCISEHVWHVSTVGDDLTGNGSLAYPFESIQRGIQQATTGDTVLIQDGTYHERISFLGKPIVVGSWILRDADADHILNTVIDGAPEGLPLSDTNSVVRFINGENANSVLHGLTVGNGEGTLRTVLGSPMHVGGGLYFSTASPTISNCKIISNSAIYGGAAALLAGSSPKFIECIIAGNESDSADIGFVDQSGLMRFEGGCRLLGSGHGFLILDGSLEIDSTRMEDCNVTGNGFGFKQFRATNSIVERSSINSCCNGAYLVNDSLLDSDVSAGDDRFLTMRNTVLMSSNVNLNSAWGTVIDSSIIIGKIRFFGNNAGRTFLTNSTILEHGIDINAGHRLYIDSCIVRTNNEPALNFVSISRAFLYITCSDFFGYSGGISGWMTGTPLGYDSTGILDTSGVIFSNPRFCNETSSDYHLTDISPCSPTRNDCGALMGALGVDCSTFVAGDADGSGSINISDAVYLINYIFAGGPVPNPEFTGDADCGGTVNISDVVYLINYIFAGGPPPCNG